MDKECRKGCDSIYLEVSWPHALAGQPGRVTGPGCVTTDLLLGGSAWWEKLGHSGCGQEGSVFLPGFDSLCFLLAMTRATSPLLCPCVLMSCLGASRLDWNLIKINLSSWSCGYQALCLRDDKGTKTQALPEEPTWHTRIWNDPQHHSLSTQCQWKLGSDWQESLKSWQDSVLMKK